MTPILTQHRYNVKNKTKAAEQEWKKTTFECSKMLEVLGDHKKTVRKYTRVCTGYSMLTLMTSLSQVVSQMLHRAPLLLGAPQPYAFLRGAIALHIERGREHLQVRHHHRHLASPRRSHRQERGSRQQNSGTCAR